MLGIIVVFFLATCSTEVKTDGILSCHSKEWAVAGRNISIVCQSNAPVKYGSLIKIDDHGIRFYLITYHWSNKPSFYNDSAGMRYAERVKVAGNLQNGTVTFTLTNITTRDRGRYVIKFKTEKDITDQETSTLVMYVFVPPTIYGCGNITLVEGNKTFSLSANISGSHPLTTHWYKGKQIWKGKTLTLPVIRRGDEGWYNVSTQNQLENKTFVDTKHIFLRVIYKPEGTQIHVLTNTSSAFSIGEQINIICKATANPPADFVSHLNKKLVQSSSSRYYGNQAQGGLYAVNLDQTGNNTFTCVAHNIVGSGPNHTVSFLVQDRRLEDNTNSSARLDIILPVTVLGIIVLGILIVVAAVLFKKKCSRQHGR